MNQRNPIIRKNQTDLANGLNEKYNSIKNPTKKYTKNQKDIQETTTKITNLSNSEHGAITSLGTHESDLHVNNYVIFSKKHQEQTSSESGKNFNEETMSGKFKKIQNDLMDLLNNRDNDDGNHDKSTADKNNRKAVLNPKIKENKRLIAGNNESNAVNQKITECLEKSKLTPSTINESLFRRNTQRRAPILQKRNKVLGTIYYDDDDVDNLQKQLKEEKRKKLTEMRSAESYLETNSDQFSTISRKRHDDEFSLLSTHPPVSWPTNDSLTSSEYYRSTRDSIDNSKYIGKDIARISGHNASMEIHVNNIESINTTKHDSERKSLLSSNRKMKNENVNDETGELLADKIMECDKDDKIKSKISPRIDKIRNEEKKLKMKKEKGKKNEEDEEGDIPCLKDIVGIDLPIEENFRKKLNFFETLIIAQNIPSVDDDKSENSKNNSKINSDEKQLKYRSLVNSGKCIQMGAIRQSIESDANKFITFFTSQFSYKNGTGGGKLLSMNDMNLNLIEEKKTEFYIKSEEKNEQSIHAFRDHDGFVIYRIRNDNGKIDKKRGNMVKNYAGDFILDGGQFILMRYLILKKFEGKLKFWSMDISGELMKCILTAGKRKIFTIGNRSYETIRIKKELISTKYETITSKTYFLSTGHMILHEWKDSNVFIHLNPYSEIPPPSYSINILQSNWKDDVILFSKYLDLKSLKKSEIDAYIYDNPEFKSMLKDFLLATLIQKPHDIMEFAIEYFLNLCDEDEKDE